MIAYVQKPVIRRCGITDEVEENRIYFLAFGRLFHLVFREESWTWEIYGTFACTHCEPDYAIDLAYLGFQLAQAGWEPEDMKLIRTLPDSIEKLAPKLLPLAVAAFEHYQRYIMHLPPEKRMIESRRYYRRHLWPSKKNLRIFW